MLHMTGEGMSLALAGVWKVVLGCPEIVECGVEVVNGEEEASGVRKDGN